MMKKNELTKLLQPVLAPLIANQTVSHYEKAHDQSNKACLDFISNQLENAGFNCMLQPVANSRNKFNLIARLDRGPGGVWLCGHSDTVSADLHHWNSNPWNLTKREESYWQGLGVSDMKGFIAQIMVLACQYPRDYWKKSLTIVITADEETTMAGARALKEEKIDHPDVIFVGEPTANKPVIAHKGYAGITVTFNGKGGHSSRAGHLPDALMVCHEFMQHLYVLRDQWKSQYHCPDFEIPWPTMNPGCLNAGDSINRICSTAKLDLDIRPVPGMNMDELTEKLRYLLASCADKHKINGKLGFQGHPVPSFCCKKDVFFVEKVTGEDKTTAGYCTEAPFFSEFCSKVVVLGPGRIDQAHQANESVFFEDLWKSVQIYEGILEHYCR